MTFTAGRDGHYNNADIFTVAGQASFTLEGTDATSITAGYTLSTLGAGTNADSGGAVYLTDAAITDAIDAFNASLETTLGGSDWTWSVSHQWAEGEYVTL